MYQNDYMYAVERDQNSLAHYGVRGMKWGVRKAIERGDSRALSRQYAKAQKKLAKLEKRAGKVSKYKKRAAALGAGAAVAGGAAALGTHGVGNIINAVGKYGAKAMKGLGVGLENAGTGIHKGLAAIGQGSLGNKIHKSMNIAGRGLQNAGSGKSAAAMQTAGEGLKRWGNSTSIGKGIQNTAGKYAGRFGAGKGAMFNTVASQNARNATKGIAKLNNNTIARIGAGAIGAGLAAGAARNAYKAATAQKKAAKFKSEMNKAFAGTKYGNGGNRQGGKKRRR